MRIGFTSKAADGTVPELSRIEFDISRNVELHTAGLPSCSSAELYSNVAGPGHSCSKSFVGRGIVDSEIVRPGEEPVSVQGHLSAFYTVRKEGRFILARVKTGAALPLVYVIPFKIGEGHGVFGTTLVVRRMQEITGVCASPGCFSPYTLKGIYSRISKLEFSLHRRFRHGSTRESFLNARCPAKSKALRLLVGMSLSYDPLPATHIGVFDDCQAEQRNRRHR